MANYISCRTTREPVIIYITPESLLTESFSRIISAVKNEITLIAIDEAHLVLEYGREFRPKYAKIYTIRE